jgi:iron complex outermembrane recepter protein
MKQTRVDLRGEVRLDGYFDRVRFSLAYADYEHREIEDDESTIFRKEGFEGRVELRHDHGQGNRGAWGVHFLNQDFSSSGHEAFIEPVTTTDAGAFVTERWDFQDWGIEAGARLDHRELDGRRASRSFTTFSGSGSVFVRPAEGWFAAATVSRTERAPSDVEVFAEGPHLATRAYEVGDLDLGAETAWSIEGTSRYTAANGVRLELSAFYADYDGFIELFPTEEFDHGLRVYEFRQQDAKLYGGEARVSAPLGDLAGFGLTGAASVDIVRGELSGGQDLPRIPPLSGTVELRAERGPLSLRTDVRLVAEQNRTFDFEYPTEGYALWNADVTWQPIEGNDLTLFAGVRNITDEEARVHSSYLKEFIPLPGRNFRLGLSTRF